MVAASHATAAAAIFIPGSTTTHKKDECRRQWHLSETISPNLFTGRSVRAEAWPERQLLPGTRIKLQIPPCAHNYIAEALTRHLQKDHEAEWKMVLTASSRSVQAVGGSARKGARRRIWWVL